MDQELRQALEKIMHLCRPGQSLYLRDAIDIICDIRTIASEQLKREVPKLLLKKDKKLKA